MFPKEILNFWCHFNHWDWHWQETLWYEYIVNCPLHFALPWCGGTPESPGLGGYRMWGMNKYERFRLWEASGSLIWLQTSCEPAVWCSCLTVKKKIRRGKKKPSNFLSINRKECPLPGKSGCWRTSCWPLMWNTVFCPRAHNFRKDTDWRKCQKSGNHVATRKWDRV